MTNERTRIGGVGPWGLGMVLTLVATAPARTRQAASDAAPDLGKLQRDPPMITDRPDFTESTDAVPRGRSQLEAGYTFSYDREDGVRTRSHTAPELLLRVGVIDNLELRFGWDGYTWQDDLAPSETRGGRTVNREDSFDGGNDLSLGIKIKLFEQAGWRPHFGVIAAFTVPSGSSEITSGDVDPELVLLWAYDVTDCFAIAGNAGISSLTEDAHRFTQTTASLSFAYSLTSRIGLYVEYFGFYPVADGEDAAHSLNGGLTYLITEDFQIDWRVGVGLNGEADDFFTGVGFAWRF